jgi:hypothetical protein
MTITEPRRIRARQALAVVAIVFGVLTLFAGGRVWFFGVDPGYTVFRPLLVYNTVMGLGYAAVGVAFWNDRRISVGASALIFALNLAVLGVISVLYLTSDRVAVDSLRAMTLRTVVWLVLAIGARQTQSSTRGHA